MAYIGKTPVIGNFVKLDSITVVNGQAAYTMQNGGANFTSYDNVNQFLVSLNGILQSPTDSFTVSGSTLTFASNLSTGDVIDFVLVLGNSLDIGTPSDNTISTAKLQANAVTSAKLGTDVALGKVLQVVNATYSTSTTTNSTSFSDSGLSASITPSSSSNKILVSVALNGIERRDSLNWLYANLLRDSTQIISDFSGRGGYIQKYGYTDSDYHTGVGGCSATYLDSPSTTSATTYKVQIKAETASNSAGICASNSTSMITLMEIST
jgi:hypothetical protein